MAKNYSYINITLQRERFFKERRDKRLFAEEF